MNKCFNICFEDRTFQQMIKNLQLQFVYKIISQHWFLAHKPFLTKMSNTSLPQVFWVYYAPFATQKLASALYFPSRTVPPEVAGVTFSDSDYAPVQNF